MSATRTVPLSEVNHCILCSKDTVAQQGIVRCCACQFTMCESDDCAHQMNEYAKKDMMRFCYACGGATFADEDCVYCEACLDTIKFDLPSAILVSVTDVLYCVLCGKQLATTGNRLRCVKECNFRANASNDETVTTCLKQYAKLGKVAYCYACGLNTKSDGGGFIACSNIGCSSCGLPLIAHETPGKATDSAVRRQETGKHDEKEIAAEGIKSSNRLLKETETTEKSVGMANPKGGKVLPLTKGRTTWGASETSNELQKKLQMRLSIQGEAEQATPSYEVATIKQENHAETSNIKSKKVMTESQVTASQAAGYRATGTVSQASRTVNQASGTVSQASRTVSQASGTVSQASGTVRQASGTVSQASGTVSQASGTVNQSVVRKKNPMDGAIEIDTKGHPKIYQPPLETLSCKKEKCIAVRVVGKKDPSFSGPGRVLMVVGATGSGKSTMINGLTNYIYGVDWEDDFRYKLIVDEGGKSQTQSQTSWITAYIFYQSNLPYTLTVIDTPGFGDTRGIERDKQIVDQIKDFFSDCKNHDVDQLHAIAFVAAASSVRLTATQRYIFDATLSIFGKDIASNIFFVATFADGQLPPVFNAASEAKIPYCNTYKFNNSALYAENASASNGNYMVQFTKMFWAMGTESFAILCRDLVQMEPRSLYLTREVLKKREHLEATVKGLQPQIKQQLAQIDSLKQERIELEKHEGDINNNKDFKYTVREQREIKVNLKPGEIITNCLNCHVTCHFPCKIPHNDKKKECAAMDANGNCTVCSERCSWELHENTPYYYDIEEVVVEKIHDAQKAKFEAAKEGKTVRQSQIDKSQKKLDQLNEAVYGMIDEVRVTLQQLKEIALKPNPLSQVEYVDVLIQSEMQDAKAGFQERIKALNVIREQAVLLSEKSLKEHSREGTSKKGYFAGIDWRRILNNMQQWQ